ncbi:methyltransferase-like protein 27 [Thunnus maccoyii]|uniref:methyltransferase-like protein 27 n=1 Tax=Thunnus maccoyii TaxID=8240 RepID=UPI001C4C2C3E|nr:methyltransferase-like protein 27 [Thunnus maccoyii]XP_042280474.1 methyltransferase-like protein 27 [Thunnus maccoyii]XP_042280475.1 methyltransferase-like protein 27 [Thunnus maccoyii]
MMCDSSRTEIFLPSCESVRSEKTIQLYNRCAETYEQDLAEMNYRAPNLAVDFLNANFSGSRQEVQVLDVACGSGLVAKLMVELGFRLFVGVDGSGGMLEQAARTGLYQDLRLALLGTQPLPAQPALFDVVIIVGALGVGFAPVSVVRELCHAAKPGGYVCMARGNHTGPAASRYKEDLERELKLMEEEGLWSPVGIKLSDRYMKEPPQICERDESQYISGTVYLYKTAS